MPTAKLNVPIIDVSSLFSQKEGNSMAKKATIKEIGDACRDWGFFYVIEHNVDSSIIQQCKDECFEFFRKPKELKRSIYRKPGTLRGYCDDELTEKIIDWKECYSYGADIIKDTQETGVSANLWPEGMSKFKLSLLEYFENVYSLSQVLIVAMFSSLNVDPAELESGTKGSYAISNCRLNLYPKCPDNKHLGCGPHTDGSCLTIVLQDERISSLQVEKEGKFYDIPPVKDSFVINIGDMAQVWSNDLYKAPKHQVLTSQDTDRLSVAFFLGLAKDTVVKPLKECISEDNPPKYRAFARGEILKTKIAAWQHADAAEELVASSTLLLFFHCTHQRRLQRGDMNLEIPRRISESKDKELHHHHIK